MQLYALFFVLYAWWGSFIFKFILSSSALQKAAYKAYLLQSDNQANVAL